jgi:hypothetical protein
VQWTHLPRTVSQCGSSPLAAQLASLVHSTHTPATLHTSRSAHATLAEHSMHLPVASSQVPVLQGRLVEQRSTQVPIEASQRFSDVQSASPRQPMHRPLDAAQRGRSLERQSASSRHSTHAPLEIAQWRVSMEQSPSVVHVP